MDKNIKLSIIIPALNEEDYIGVLLDCLVNQTYKNFEVVVADGDSKDKTIEVCEKYKDRLDIRAINAKRHGISFQRNFGVKQATTDHIIFFDADGCIEDAFLEKVVNYITNHKDVDILTTWIEPLSTKKIDKVLYFTYNQFYLDLVKKIKPQGGGAFIYIRKPVFEALGGFDEKAYVAEDHDLFARSHKAGYKYHLIKSPVIKTSVRRLDKQGRLRYIFAMSKGAVHLHLIGPIENSKFIDYFMDEGGAFYKVNENIHKMPIPLPHLPPKLKFLTLKRRQKN